MRLTRTSAMGDHEVTVPCDWANVGRKPREATDTKMRAMEGMIRHSVKSE
jgi:hypothetical protein